MPPELPADRQVIDRITTVGAKLADMAYTSGSNDTERIVIALGFLAAAVAEFSGSGR